jgi:hypothetical protein
VTVVAPPTGSGFADQQEILFAWEAPGAAVILLVFAARPQSTDDMPQKAIWGTMLPASSTGLARWADGVAIHGGMWQATLDPAPTNVPLYLVIQAMQDFDLVAVSPLVSFYVGTGAPSAGAWPAPGDPCSPDLSRSDCENPARAQLCFEGQCRILCASHDDCFAYDPKLRCDVDVDLQLRVCK